jgi:hypothetical protein
VASRGGQGILVRQRRKVSQRSVGTASETRTGHQSHVQRRRSDRGERDGKHGREDFQHEIEAPPDNDFAGGGQDDDAASDHGEEQRSHDRGPGRSGKYDWFIRTCKSRR